MTALKWIRIARWLAPVLVVAALLAAMPLFLLLRPAPVADFAKASSATTCTQDQPVEDATLTGVLSVSEVAALGTQVGFPAREIPMFVAIATAESGRNPKATNRNTNGTTDWGLLQINDVNAAVLASGDKFNPLDNARMAYSIWKSWGNWKAWATFNSGSYQKFLPGADEIAYDLPGCTPADATRVIPVGADATKGYPNGQIPRRLLYPLWADGSKVLKADAAATFNDLSHAYFARFGEKPCVTDAYRSLAEQIDVRRRKPTLAAVPGTSNHGLGQAVDLGCGAEVPGSDVDVWLHANAGRWGWLHPAWAEPDGSKPEPWHWQYLVKN